MHVGGGGLLASHGRPSPFFGKPRFLKSPFFSDSETLFKYKNNYWLVKLVGEIVLIQTGRLAPLASLCTQSDVVSNYLHNMHVLVTNEMRC